MPPSFIWREVITIHYEIIINPASGSGKGTQVWKIIQQALHDQHVSFSDHISHSAGQPRQIVLQLLQSPAFHPDCIIVIGGDGTLHEVISGLMQAKQNEHSNCFRDIGETTKMVMI